MQLLSYDGKILYNQYIRSTNTRWQNLTVFVVADIINKTIELIIEPTKRVKKKLPTDDHRDFSDL